VSAATWRWTARGLLRAGGIAAVALSTGAALGYAVAHEPTPRAAGASAPDPEPRSPLRPELQLLAPLHEGSTLEGFDLAEIPSIGEDGVLRISCRRAHTTIRIEVTLAPTGGEAARAPRAIAGRYAVSYVLERNGSPEEGELLAAAIAAVLKANAAASPPWRLRPSAPARR
jgi:hypothetical protein